MYGERWGTGINGLVGPSVVTGSSAPTVVLNESFLTGLLHSSACRRSLSRVTGTLHCRDWAQNLVFSHEKHLQFHLGWELAHALKHDARIEQLCNMPQ